MLASGTLSLTIAGAGDDANADGDLDVLDHLTLRGAGSGSTEIGADFMDRVLIRAAPYWSCRI